MTPVATTVDVKTLQINGENVSARADQTILEVARENGIFIPTLCHLDGLTDVGACRICLVEIKGSPKLFPACVAKVEEGMEVTTASPRYLLAMKLMAMRFGEDDEDIEILLRECDIHSAQEALDVLEQLYPAKAPPAKTRFFLEELLGRPGSEGTP